MVCGGVLRSHHVCVHGQVICTQGPAVQYYILTENSKFTQVLSWLGMHMIPYSVHLNRTRFTLDTQSRLHTEFMLRYGDCCDVVDPDADLVTGQHRDVLLTHIP